MELSENPDKRKDTDDQERRYKPEGQYTPRRESVQVNIYIYFQNRQKRKANAAERKDSRQQMKRASAAQRILYFTMLCIKEKAEKSQNTEIQDQYPAEFLANSEADGADSTCPEDPPRVRIRKSSAACSEKKTT